MFTRRTRVRSVAILTAAPVVALVTLTIAGCAASSSPAGAGGGTATGRGATTAASAPVSPGSASPGSASPSPVSPGSGSTASASPPPSTPVTAPGPVVPNEDECSGWPANVPVETLPASFEPVSVIRCVTAFETVPGKGQWLAAELQRADSGLAPLAAALRQPTGRLRPGVMCPDYVILPPAFILTGQNGTMIRPRLPLNGCGTTQSRVLSVLAALPWKTVSVKLISPANTVSPGTAAP
jgi:hypothetical protein